MVSLSDNIRSAHSDAKLSLLSVDSALAADGRRTFVFYDDPEGKDHDFYLYFEKGNLVLDEPRGPPKQVIYVAKGIAGRYQTSLVISNSDVPKEFKEALTDLGYELIEGHWRKVKNG